MKSLQAEKIQVSPEFDLEVFMLLSGNRRLKTEKVLLVEREWKRMVSFLKAYRLGQKSKGYLVIFLDSAIEKEIDQAMETEPDMAEQLEIIAQCLIMTSMCQVLPKAHIGSCAPVPEPNKILKRSLKPLGIDLLKNGRLNVRYGVVTKLPYKNDCQDCALKSSCAKRLPGSQNLDMTLS